MTKEVLIEMTKFELEKLDADHDFSKERKMEFAKMFFEENKCKLELSDDDLENITGGFGTGGDLLASFLNQVLWHN